MKAKRQMDPKISFFTRNYHTCHIHHAWDVNVDDEDGDDDHDGDGDDAIDREDDSTRVMCLRWRQR